MQIPRIYLLYRVTDEWLGRFDVKFSKEFNSHIFCSHQVKRKATNTKAIHNEEIGSDSDEYRFVQSCLMKS